jgi:type III pantothenate kinase
MTAATTPATTTLLIDAGNSSLKWALCHKGQLIKGDPVVYQEGALEQQLSEAWQCFPKKNLNPTKIILANVAGQRVLDALSRWRDDALNATLAVKETGGVTIEIVIAQANAYGVKNAYEQPETLGADRWASLIAARHSIKGDACIIGCGTALTVDILTAGGEHMGGVIAPGWEMMKSGLVTNTNGITSGEGEVPELLGQSTQQAVQAGISAASVGAVKHILQRFENDMGTVFTCIVTGGGAPLLLPQLLSLKYAGVFQHEPDWVFKGLAVLSGNPLNESFVNDSGVQL